MLAAKVCVVLLSMLAYQAHAQRQNVVVSHDHMAERGAHMQQSLAVPDEATDRSRELVIPDDELRAAVEAALETSGMVVDDLVVRVENGVLFIAGTTKSRLAKSRISQLARNVRGVKRIINDIEVNPRFSVQP